MLETVPPPAGLGPRAPLGPFTPPETDLVIFAGSSLGGVGLRELTLLWFDLIEIEELGRFTSEGTGETEVRGGLCAGAATSPTSGSSGGGSTNLGMGGAASSSGSGGGSLNVGRGGRSSSSGGGSLNVGRGGKSGSTAAGGGGGGGSGGASTTGSGFSSRGGGGGGLASTGGGGGGGSGSDDLSGDLIFFCAKN